MSELNDSAPKMTLWTYGGVRNVVLDDAHDCLDLGSGFSLIKPNSDLLSARHRYFMSEEEYKDAETVRPYLLYKSQQSAYQAEMWDESLEAFQHGVVALQILKPVRTLGFVFQGSVRSGTTLSPGPTNHRPPTDAGQWARMRPFDD